MANKQAPTTREERLAARLRENLKRRKQQGKQQESVTGKGHDSLSKAPDGG